MKSLGEIDAHLSQVDSKTEKRTPISSLPYPIGASGSYYLAGDLTATGSGGGIIISADNVTVDLNGFALIGGGGGTVAGINVANAQKNLCIRNGIIRGWTGAGVQASASGNSMYEDLRVSDTGGGILVGTDSVVRDCSVSDTVKTTNAVAHPSIQTGNGCSVKNCVTNGGDYGIQVGENSVVAFCSANNAAGGNFAIGIDAGSGSTITNCSVGYNTFGINTAFGCSVLNCTARRNIYGIQTSDSCYLAGNAADYNSDSGFYLGRFSRIDSNSATANTSYGFTTSGTGNLVIRNNARGNGTDYNIDTGTNTRGPLIVGPGSISTTNPWVNFSNE